MVTLSISDEIKIKCFDNTLAEALGGQRVVEMLVLYHQERMTPQELAETFKLSSHVQASRLLDRANAVLRRIGIWPPHWSDRYRSPGQKKYAVVNIEKLHV